VAGGATDASGSRAFVLGGIARKTTSVTFDITNVTLAGYYFDPRGPSSVAVSRP